MPWLGESTHFACRQAWVWEVASSSKEEEIPHSVGEVPCRDSAKAFCALLELFTKMKGLGVAGLRVLLGSHFKNLFNFLTLHSLFSRLCCKAQAVALAMWFPTLNSLELAALRIQDSFLLFPPLPWFEKQFGKFSSGMEIDEKKPCGLCALFLDTQDQEGLWSFKSVLSQKSVLINYMWTSYTK